MSNGFSKFVDRLVNEALKEVLILTEGESDERARMERALRSRYNEAEEETEATEKPIDAEKITPGAAKQRSETEQEDNDGGTGSSERPSNEPPVIEIPDEEQLMSPTYDFAKEQINSFRAGASLNNETVDSNFRKYFESLSEAEKRAVIIYSTALAQIARGMMPADEVITASKAGLGNSDKAEKQPGDAAAQKQSMSTSPAQAQDDDSVMPIVVGESATVRRLIQRARKD